MSVLINKYKYPTWKDEKEKLMNKELRDKLKKILKEGDFGPIKTMQLLQMDKYDLLVENIIAKLQSYLLENGPKEINITKNTYNDRFLHSYGKGHNIAL